jgi:hypothetical protein
MCESFNILFLKFSEMKFQLGKTRWFCAQGSDVKCDQSLPIVESIHQIHVKAIEIEGPWYTATILGILLQRPPNKRIRKHDFLHQGILYKLILFFNSEIKWLEARTNIIIELQV